MKKIILTLLIFLFSTCFSFGYDLYLQKGTLIQAYPKTSLSTEALEEGSKVYFIAPCDVWLVEKKVIEKGDIFFGHVSLLKMPILGVNAAMKIAITHIAKLNGEIRELNGHILFGSNETLGGNLTNPASYNTMIHLRKTYKNPWGGVLQYVPSGEYEYGNHVGITARDSVYVVLDEDYYI